MGRNVFVDGDLLITTGSLYVKNISAGGRFHPTDSDVIVPPRGQLLIKDRMGSIFDSYYVSGAVATKREGSLFAFIDIYDFTVKEYESGRELIRKMATLNVPTQYNTVFYQQLYASIFSLLERFLSCTFIKQTCSREESYRNVLNTGFLQRKFGQFKNILNGPDCLSKELLYIELTNRIVYHNQKSVKELFESAFGIDVDLSSLNNQINVRNDIIHRFGFTTKGIELSLTKNDVDTLLDLVNSIVIKTATQISELSIHNSR